MVGCLSWDILGVGPEDEMQAYAALFDRKDLHVLAAAAAGRSVSLLALGRWHPLSCVPAVEEAGFRIRILTPSDFTQPVWPLLEEFASLPAGKG